MFSVVFSSANQQLVIFNHTGVAVLFQQVIQGLSRSVVEHDMGGERNPLPTWREPSPVTPSTTTIVGTFQMSRSSCCPAIPAACAAALLGWMVNILWEVTWGHATTRQVDPSLPVPHHPHKALVTLTADTALTEMLKSSRVVAKGYLTFQGPGKAIGPGLAGSPFQLSPDLQGAACFRVWAPRSPRKQTRCLNHSMVPSPRGQWQWRGFLKALSQS